LVRKESRGERATRGRPNITREWRNRARPGHVEFLPAPRSDAEVAVTADHQAQVEELLADYRRGRDQLASVHHALAAVRESATSPDGLVTVTVGPGGILLDLRFADVAYRNYRPERLAALIVETTATAAAKAARVANDLVAPVLPAGADPAALLGGTADLTPGELAPPARPAVDERSFEERTWLQSGGTLR
jgi:DNA-binding protein YbaB